MEQYENPNAKKQRRTKNRNAKNNEEFRVEIQKDNKEFKSSIEITIKQMQDQIHIVKDINLPHILKNQIELRAEVKELGNKLDQTNHILEEYM